MAGASLCRSPGAGGPAGLLAGADHHVPRLAGAAARRRRAGHGRHDQDQVRPSVRGRVDHLAAGADLQLLLSAHQVGAGSGIPLRHAPAVPAILTPPRMQA